MKLKNIALGAMIAAGLGASTASAHSIQLGLLGTAPIAGGTAYSYTVVLTGSTPANELVSGSEFVLYDFAGLFGTPTFSGSNFSAASIQLTTPFPIAQGAGITDNPTIPNIVFTYTGPTFVGGANNITLGTVVADSAYGLSTPGTFPLYYAGQDQQVGGSIQGNSGFLPGPLVPASNAGLGGAALLGLLGAAKLLKSRRAAV